ncbi:MAG TPA: HAD-IA family hydrolase [Chloroflexota bacterium]|nr:HAD-IA family hydrolase [Chloroflexota bacterium]
MRARALIFDFDGLILDTETAALRSWQEVFEEHGCLLDVDRYCRTLGTAPGSSDTFDLLQTAAGRPLDRLGIEERRLRRKAELTAGEKLLPGVEDYLAEAQRMGLRLAVASSSPRYWVAGHLERLGVLSPFDAIVTRDDVAHAKPAPDLYLKAVATLGIPASASIAIEDSANGIAAARAAGLFVLAVPNSLTARIPLGDPDVTVDSLAALPLPKLLGLHDATW